MTYTVDDIPPGMASDALFAQSACNLGAVVHTFDRHVKLLQAQGKDTDWVNQHPVVLMFLNQFCHLAFGTVPDDHHGRLLTAWTLCEEAKKRDERKPNGTGQ
jgi:hypothetical protein